MNMSPSHSNERTIELRARPRSAKAALPSATAVSPADAVLKVNLEELRRYVLRRLDSIEALARGCSGVPSAELARSEQMLKQTLEELERERNRARIDAAGPDAAGKQMLMQLENDRQLLTDAWERLEQERIDALTQGTTARPAHADHAPHPVDAQVVHGQPAQRRHGRGERQPRRGVHPSSVSNAL